MMLLKKNKRGEEIKDWIVSDIEEMIKICKERGSKVILQNYPIRKPPVNKILKDISSENSVPFINNYKIFQKYRKNILFLVNIEMGEDIKS